MCIAVSISQPITLTGDLTPLIRNAATAAIENTVGPTDGPETGYYGNMLREVDIMEYVDLGAQRQRRAHGQP